MWGLFYLCDQTPIFVFKSKVKLGARNASGVSQSVSQSSGHEFRDESRLTNGCPSIYPSVRRHFFYGDISIFISKPPFNAFPLWGSHPLAKAWRGYRILMVLIGTNRPHAGLYSARR